MGRPRGTAAMDPETRKRVAQAGGRALSANREHMSKIGKKGGAKASRNRAHMAEIGRKGGSAKRRPRDTQSRLEGTLSK